jgi:hypothetical protein
MKPGDLIEWAYVYNNAVVSRYELLWSTTMQTWVPIGGVHMLVARVEGVLSWLPLGTNCEGLLHAREDYTGKLLAGGDVAVRLLHALVNNTTVLRHVHGPDQVAPRTSNLGQCTA